MFVAYQLLELRDDKVSCHGVTPFYFSTQEMVVPMLFYVHWKWSAKACTAACSTVTAVANEHNNIGQMFVCRLCW